MVPGDGCAGQPPGIQPNAMKTKLLTLLVVCLSALFARADNPADMAQVPVEEIRDIIRPCGLSPAKSKGISGLSKIIMEKHGGAVPESFEELEKLPGVGHKTCLLYTSPSPRDRNRSRMPSFA